MVVIMRRFLLFFLIVIPSVLFVVKVVIQQSHKEVAGTHTALLSPLSSITPPADSLVGKVVEGALEGTKGIYGVVVLNLKTNESYFLNDHRQFKTGSLYKLWVMATAYEQIKAGTLKESDILSEDIGILHSKFGLASPSAIVRTIADTNDQDAAMPTVDPNKITYSVGDALEQMIIISDNYAALLLTERVKLANISSFLQRNGFIESRVGINGGDPMTTAYDMALFLKKLYAGELADKNYTEKMITLLKRQRLNGKLPKYLPEDTTIAHKTGELDEFTHDVGIVYAPSGDYIIAVLSESNSRPQAEERIANVSEAVYKYLQK